MNDASPAPTSLPLTIGALSLASGVPVNTLRTWERRYGFPSSDRSEGGHRLFPPETVARLRLVLRALNAGHRPAQVLSAAPEALARLLDETATEIDPPTPARGASDQGHARLEAWLSATRALDGAALVRCFGEDAARLGLPRFLDERAIPFLHAVGDGWETGQLTVAHEHFASARLSAFLAGSWRPIADAARGPLVVCATAPGDHHELSLHMVATLLAVAGHRVSYLGSDLPVAEIVRAVQLSGAGVVVMGISSTAAEPRRSAEALRSFAAPHVRVILGGAGAPRDIPGTTFLADLMQIAEAVQG